MSREPDVSGEGQVSSGAAGASPTDALVRDLLRWEGATHHLYKDSRGFVTCGIGNLVKNADAATQLPWLDAKTGQPATRAQIAAAFAAVEGAPTGKGAGSYAPLTTIRLSEGAVTSLVTARLEHEFLPALRREFPGFDGYPAPAQRALVDMAYNLGAGGLAKFSALRAACEAGDWARASGECHRKTSRPERNEYTKNLFLDAARVA